DAADAIARLQHGTQSRVRATAHQAQMAPVCARHQLEDYITLAVALAAEHDAFVGPLHRLVIPKLKSHPTVAFRILAPTLAHLDEQKQVHRSLDHVGDLPPRIGADRLNGMPALAEDDLTLAFALDVDRLLDTDRAILEF